MATLTRWLVVALAAVTVLVATHHIVELVRLKAGNSEAGAVSLHIAFSAYALLAAISALAIGLRAWQRREARLLAAFLVLAAVSLNVFALHGLFSGTVHGYAPAVDLIASTAAAFGLAALLRFVSVFPIDMEHVQRPADIRVKRTTNARLANAIDVLQRTTASPVVAWSAAVVLALLLATNLIRFSLPTAMICVVVTSILVLIQLFAAYRNADEEAREKVQWLIAAAAAGGAIVAIDAALLVVYVVAGFEPPVPAWDAWLLIVGCMVGLLLIITSVFYRGDIDPALVIHRSVIIGMAGPLMVFAFAAAEELATSFITERLEMDARVATWIAAGTVAVLITALRNRFHAILTWLKVRRANEA